MDPTIDPRVAKLLGDLLALTLSENGSQAEAAIGAIRRRAARDEVTGGTLKQLVDQLLAAGRPPAPKGPSAHEISEMRWTIQEQHRELEQLRLARRRAEAALTDSTATNESLAEAIGRLNDRRRNGWKVGFAAGLGFAVLAFAGYGVLSGGSRGGVRVGLDRVARAGLADYVRGCFLASSNSLAGTAYGIHLLIDVDADGRIARAVIAPDQADRFGEPDQKTYGEMMLRTLRSGSCGSLPLPSTLRGKPGEFDLYLR